MTVWLAISPIVTAFLTAIFMKYWEAYGSEKGKNLARKEDLDKILLEVRAVTIAQKEIENKLSGDLWHQQMRWNQKRDIYAELIKHTFTVSGKVVALKHILEKPEGYPSSYLADKYVEFVAAGEPFLNAMALGKIFMKEDGLKVLDAYMNQAPPVPLTLAWAVLEIRSIQRLHDGLVKVAREDLNPSS